MKEVTTKSSRLKFESDDRSVWMLSSETIHTCLVIIYLQMTIKTYTC